MRAGRLWRLLLPAATLLTAAGAGIHHYSIKPGCRNGLPEHDYQHVRYSQPEAALSQVALLIEQSPPRETGGTSPALAERVDRVVRERIKFYQLPESKLQIDHCSISRVALTLHDSGHWVLSLRADQNPRLPEDPEQTRPAKNEVKGTIKQTAHLKRNRFFLKVRCYGAYPVKESRPEAAAGKPVLFRIEPEPFWVQNGVPYDFWARSPQPVTAVSQYFDLIDRVEVEFYHR